MKKIKIIIDYFLLLFRKFFWFISGNNIELGENCEISLNTKLNAYSGKIRIGNNCKIYDYVIISTYGGIIDIGDNVRVNSFCKLTGNGGLKIGKDVSIASGTKIFPFNHSFEENKRFRDLKQKHKGIVIEENVWIGSDVSILDGSFIKRNNVIGAKSLINFQTDESAVYISKSSKASKLKKI